MGVFNYLKRKYEEADLKRTKPMIAKDDAAKRQAVAEKEQAAREEALTKPNPFESYHDGEEATRGPVFENEDALAGVSPRFGARTGSARRRRTRKMKRRRTRRRCLKK